MRESALTGQKQDLRLFIEPDIYSMGIPAIIWRADPATLQFWSVEGAAEEILGYPRSHWLTQREFFEERIYPEDRAPTLALYRAALAAGGDASAEYRAVSHPGKLFGAGRRSGLIGDGSRASSPTSPGVRNWSDCYSPLAATRRNTLLPDGWPTI